MAAHLDDGRVVAVVCEGDPLFYGSYMHLHVRLARRFRTEVVAGRERYVRLLVGGRHADRPGRRRVHGAARHACAKTSWSGGLVEADAVVVMKLGRNLPKVRRALERTGRLARAVYVERGTMAGEKAIPLADKAR